jgi:hypothetical protein
MPSLDASIKKLREIAPALNKAADDAARIVQEVENVLTKELSLALKAEYVIEQAPVVDEEDREATDHTVLAYRRVKGKFRIAVAVDRETPMPYAQSSFATVSETPWSECPQDVKLETFTALPHLLEELAKKAEVACESVAKTQQAVRELLGEPPAAKPLLDAAANRLSLEAKRLAAQS